MGCDCQLHRQEHELFLHCPEGATPKDGPSAAWAETADASNLVKTVKTLGTDATATRKITSSPAVGRARDSIIYINISIYPTGMHVLSERNSTYPVHIWTRLQATMSKKIHIDMVFPRFGNIKQKVSYTSMTWWHGHLFTFKGKSARETSGLVGCWTPGFQCSEYVDLKNIIVFY